MISLELCVRYGQYGLYKRDYSGVEVDWTKLLKLSKEQAHAISGKHTGLFLSERHTKTRVYPLNLYIKRKSDRQPHAHAWDIYIGEDKIASVPDETVKLLVEHAKVYFEEGQPNWDMRKIEDLDDLIFDADKTLKELQAARHNLIRNYFMQKDFRTLMEN